jgi:hypothetical protein
MGLYTWGVWMSVWHAVWSQCFSDASLMLKLFKHTLHAKRLPTFTSLWLVLASRSSRGIRTWGLAFSLLLVTRSGKLINMVASRLCTFLASSTTLIRLAATGLGTWISWAATRANLSAWSLAKTSNSDTPSRYRRLWKCKCKNSIYSRCHRAVNLIS